MTLIKQEGKLVTFSKHNGEEKIYFNEGRLIVAKDGLQIRVLAGFFIFQPSDVLSIQPYKIDEENQGIKIIHQVKKYKANLIFLVKGKSQGLISEIQNTGFLDNNKPIDPKLFKTIKKFQKGGSAPLKKSSMLFLKFIVWSLVITHLVIRVAVKYDYYLYNLTMALPVFFIFFMYVLIIFIKPFRWIILRKGFYFNDIKTPFYLFFIFITLGLSLFISIRLPAVWYYLFRFVGLEY